MFHHQQQTYKLYGNNQDYQKRQAPVPKIGQLRQEQKRNFNIHYKFKNFEVNLFVNSTINQLYQLVLQKIQHDSHFVCLESINKNQMIDFVLLKPAQKVKIFRNNQSFKVYLSDYENKTGMPSLADYYFIKCLGQGGSATVNLVRHKKSGKIYALKQVDKQYFIQFKRMEQILREKKILSQILYDFPFIIKLYRSFESQKYLNFLLQFYPGGQLFLHLQRRRFNQHQTKLYFAQVFLTFQHLHKNKIIYRDLKPENIMIDFDGHIKLADFGLCKLNLTRQQFTHSYCGSLQYMAPEVKQNQGYNYSVDFYTMGAFLYEMVIGVPPYYNNQQLYFPEKISKGLMQLIKGLIEKKIQKRIDNFQQIRKSSWLQNMNWNDIYNKKYEMPIKLSIYETYIHEQFSKIKIDHMNSQKQEKFDRLFNMFFYQRENLKENQHRTLNKKAQNIQLKKYVKSITQKSKQKKSTSQSKGKTHGGIQLVSKEKSPITRNSQKNYLNNMQKNFLKSPERIHADKSPFTKKTLGQFSPTYPIITNSKTSANILHKIPNIRIQSPNYRKSQNQFQNNSIRQSRPIFFRKI